MKKEHSEEFQRLESLSGDAPRELKQARGLDFESLINRIMAEEGILLRSSYHTDDNRSEQIDGAVGVNGRVFLLEMKWVASDLAASELYAFIGKIENKFHGTLGVFISRTPLTDNFLSALNKGRRQTVIVIHGEDVELIFKNEFSFKDYIDHVVKVLSYENMVHFPVKKYLGMKSPVPREKPTGSVQAVAFLQKNLMSAPTDKGQLEIDINFGDPATLQMVYSYVLAHFHKVYKEAMATFSYAQYRNYEAFLELYTPTEPLIISEARNYYTKLVQLDLRAYDWSLFTNMFSPYYDKLTIQEQSEFEQYITSKFEAVFGQYDDENSLTEIIFPLWDKLTIATQKKLSTYYLNIFISDRLDKFAQKSFANKLIREGKINKETINTWLQEKIDKAVESFSNDTSEATALFIARAYHPIAQVIGIDTKSWVGYIKERMPK